MRPHLSRNLRNIQKKGGKTASLRSGVTHVGIYLPAKTDCLWFRIFSPYWLHV